MKGALGQLLYYPFLSQEGISEIWLGTKSIGGYGDKWPRQRDEPVQMPCGSVVQGPYIIWGTKNSMYLETSQ